MKKYAYVIDVLNVKKCEIQLDLANMQMENSQETEVIDILERRLDSLLKSIKLLD